MKPCAILIAVSLLSVSCTLSDRTQGEAGGDSANVELLDWSEQMAVRDVWLETRHEMLLPMMQRHAIDMWIVVNEEFHNDPLTEYIAPARPYTGRRDVFVFIDTGADGLRKVAATGYWEETVARYFESPIDPRPSAAVLRELYETYRPQRIGLGFGGSRGVTRSLTHDSYQFLVDAMGSEAASRFVSAESLINDYLATRIPGELEVYTDLVALTESITKRALSNEAITPGTTTVGDVRRFMYDELWRKGVRTWFQPDLRVQRRGMAEVGSRGFLAVAPEDIVLQRGDLVHIDFGISYMGLDSDWQKMAYILPADEEDVPQGLKDALANTNALQD
ncbi:MAG: hypothetical protein L7T80_11060, partial [Arenicellales bacterium]|nr:hypothetical protein [Arenicellales bacterium]